jgi:hypothetical protein
LFLPRQRRSGCGSAALVTALILPGWGDDPRQSRPL